MKFLKYAVADLFDSKIIKYSLAPLFLSIVFWGAVFYLFSGKIVDYIHAYVSYLPFGENINAILLNIGSTFLLVFLFYELVILGIGVFSSFFVDKITARINEKYYRLPQKEVSLLEGIIVSIKGIILFVIVFLFTFYLLFIPVVNIFYQVFLWSLAVKKPLVFDSVGMFCDYKKFEKTNNFKIWTLVYLSSFLYFIPLISFFGYTLQLIIMTHFALSKCKNK